jgi:hypothetical protein
MRKIKGFLVDNAYKINIGVGIAVVVGFATLCVILIKKDIEIG